jgi:hypothetical protein
VAAGTAYWIKCAVAVENNGTIAQGSTSCIDSTSDKSKLMGKVSLKSASLCTYSGSVTYIGDSLVFRITEAKLSRDHDTAAGVGIFKGAGVTLDMIRN